VPTLIESWQLGSDSAHCDQEPEKEHGEEEAWRMEEDGEGLLYKIQQPSPGRRGKLDMVPGCSGHG
jgi:hypothetical protein